MYAERITVIFEVFIQTKLILNEKPVHIILEKRNLFITSKLFAALLVLNFFLRPTTSYKYLLLGRNGLFT